jgi:hypothetical protein
LGDVLSARSRTSPRVAHAHVWSFLEQNSMARLSPSVWSAAARRPYVRGVCLLLYELHSCRQDGICGSSNDDLVDEQRCSQASWELQGHMIRLPMQPRAMLHINLSRSPCFYLSMMNLSQTIGVPFSGRVVVIPGVNMSPKFQRVGCLCLQVEAGMDLWWGALWSYYGQWLGSMPSCRQDLSYSNDSYVSGPWSSMSYTFWHVANMDDNVGENDYWSGHVYLACPQPLKMVHFLCTYFSSSSQLRQELSQCFFFLKIAHLRNQAVSFS